MSKLAYPIQFLKEGKQLFIGDGNRRLVLTNKEGAFCKKAGYNASGAFAKENGLRLAPYDAVISAIAGLSSDEVHASNTFYGNAGDPFIVGSGTIIAYPEKMRAFQKGVDFTASGSLIPASSIPDAAFGVWNIAIKMYPENFTIGKDGCFVFEADPKTVEIISGFPRDKLFYSYDHGPHDVDKIGISGIFPVKFRNHLNQGFNSVEFTRNEGASICQMGVSLELTSKFYGVPVFRLEVINLPASEASDITGFIEK